MNHDALLPSAMRARFCSMAVVEREVAAAFGLTVDDLHKRNRTDRIVWPRQVAMYFMRQISRATQQQIAARFGKCHTTVLCAERRVTDMSISYPKLRAELFALSERIENENRTAGQTAVAERTADLSPSERALIRNRNGSHGLF